MGHISHFNDFTNTQLNESDGYYYSHTQLKTGRVKFVVTIKGIGMNELGYLNKPTTFISLRKDGSIMRVFNDRTLDWFDMDYFIPMDNGNPSLIVCNILGYPLYSVMMDKENNTLMVCDKNPHTKT